MDEATAGRASSGAVVLLAVLSYLALTVPFTLADNVQVTAHRGYSRVAPQNTLSAIRAAIDVGADWAEIDVQETRDGEVILDISFSPPIGLFQSIIEQQRPSKDWTISIFDGEGINFARVPNPQATIGRQAAPSLDAAMSRTQEATLQTVSLEGVPLITSFARSSITGSAISIPSRGRWPSAGPKQL